MLQTSGPINWEIARQVGATVAVTDPETGAVGVEPSWSSDDARRLEELTRIAQTHVAGSTGIGGVHGLELRVVRRQELARSFLDGLQPVLESLAVALGAPDTGEPPPPFDPLAAMTSEDGLAQLIALMTPTLLGVQAGTMSGRLAQRALARYEIALPLADAPRLEFSVASIREFVDAWELDFDDVGLALALREATRAAQRTVGWVPEEFVRRAQAFVAGYAQPETDATEALHAIDPSDPEALQSLMGDPGSLLGMIRSPAQEPLRADLVRFVAVVEGHTDVVAADIGKRLVATFGQVDEALGRRRVDRGMAADLLESLLGLDVGRDDYAAGRSFCAGVLERAGPEGLNRLWESPERLPTAPELEAPGLWLARIEL